jgi:hypothetical protein
MIPDSPLIIYLNCQFDLFLPGWYKHDWVVTGDGREVDKNSNDHGRNRSSSYFFNDPGDRRKVHQM